ncbi:hypothetical protein GJ496_003925 [Pomphorhynchus laevis]|nr:hypothetical protein GJ496_003925 [Pomphorhynchus laevis]
MSSYFCGDLEYLVIKINSSIGKRIFHMTVISVYHPPGGNKDIEVKSWAQKFDENSFEYFNKLINECFSKCIPCKAYKMTNRDPEWITALIKDIEFRRQKAFKQNNTTNYSRLSVKLNNKIGEARMAWANNKLGSRVKRECELDILEYNELKTTLDNINMQLAIPNNESSNVFNIIYDTQISISIEISENEVIDTIFGLPQTGLKTKVIELSRDHLPPAMLKRILGFKWVNTDNNQRGSEKTLSDFTLTFSVNGSSTPFGNMELPSLQSAMVGHNFNVNAHNDSELSTSSTDSGCERILGTVGGSITIVSKRLDLFGK